MKNILFTAMVGVLVMAMAACGPPPPVEEPGPAEPTAEELAQQRAEAEAPYHATIQKFNEAIWELKPDLLHEALTEETYELFMERAKLEAQLRDMEEPGGDIAFLKQQQDYKIVYSVKSIDLESGHAVVVGTIEGEVQWESEINFLDVDGELKIDHATVLEKSIADLEDAIETKKERLEEEAKIKAKVEALVADHNMALADKDPEAFEATITAEMAELCVKVLGLLPKKQGGKKKPNMKKYMKYVTSKVAKVEIESIDYEAMTVTLKHFKPEKKGEEPAPPFVKAVKLTEEGGRLLLDYSEGLKSRVEKLEAALEESK
jgi:hypothetical protein